MEPVSQVLVNSEDLRSKLHVSVTNAESSNSQWELTLISKLSRYFTKNTATIFDESVQVTLKMSGA